MKKSLYEDQKSFFADMTSNTAAIAFFSDKGIAFYLQCQDATDEKALRCFWGMYDTASRISRGRKIQIFCKAEKRYYEKLLALKLFEMKVIVYQEYKRTIAEIQVELKDFEVIVVANGDGNYRKLCYPIDLAKKNFSELNSTFWSWKQVYDNAEIVCGTGVKANIFGNKVLVSFPQAQESS
jgi:hypothetical protein